MNKLTVFALVILMAIISGCSGKVTTAAFHNYNTECLGKSMDGKQTLRVWASGKGRSNAIKQAKKKAVYEVVFTGINGGSGECNSFPVVSETNARKKYEEYFDLFFADDGAYKKYVISANQNWRSIDRFQGDGTVMYGIIVSVDRSALYQRLVSDNIIVK